MNEGPRAIAETRPARAGDRATILELVQAASLPLDGIEEHLADFVIAGAADGTILAVAGLEMREGAALLRSVVVVPHARGLGIGEFLIRDVLRRAAARGLGEIYLLTDGAADYFPRFGFEPIPRDAAPAGIRDSAEFRTERCAGAVCMRAALRGGEVC